MEFSGEVEIGASKDRVWELVSDPEVLTECVPGAEEVEQLSEDRYRGTIKRGIAGVNLSLEGEVEMVKLNPPDNLTAEASGEDARTNSRMDATAGMTMTELDAATTELSYEVDMSFTGRLASLGSRIVKRKINSDIKTFFDNVRDRAEDEEA